VELFAKKKPPKDKSAGGLERQMNEVAKLMKEKDELNQKVENYKSALVLANATIGKLNYEIRLASKIARKKDVKFFGDLEDKINCGVASDDEKKIYAQQQKPKA